MTDNSKLGTSRGKAGAHFTDGHVEALLELDRYKILVESIEDYAIFMLDTDGYIMSWNNGAQRAKGYAAEEIIGKHFSQFYSDEDNEADKPARELALAIKQGRVEDEDWRVRKDGSKFWANVVITSLYDTNGTHIGFAKVTRDLTDRKHQEDQVRRANVQLKQQQRELEKLNVSKDEFISVASHQLRTPATAIKQLLGILTEGLYENVSPEVMKVIAKAYESNERQLNIVNNLLKVAQVDAGKVVLNRTEGDLAKLLTDLAEEYGDTVAKRDQTMIVESLSSDPLLAVYDPDYLRMAISNLVDNASKYTPNGGIVRIITDQDDENTYVRIKDNGVGISDEDMQKLFVKFVRIPNEMSQKVGGSGLGLYWLQKIIELHGGSVTIESELTKGTTFKIVLPKATE